MKRKCKKKIKWVNVIKAIIFLFCISMIIHDFYMLTLCSWITGAYYGFTYFGLLTFIFYCCLAGLIWLDFKETIEKTQASCDSLRLKID